MNVRLLSLLCLGMSLTAAGEPQAWSWPKVVRMIIEDVKPGKEVAHQQNEFAWAKAYAEAKSPYHFLGMTPVFGGSQAWWAASFTSMAELEKSNALTEKDPILKSKVDACAAKDGDYVTNFSMAAYALRPDLSRGPGAIAPRFYWIYTVRVRPGHDGEFDALILALNGTYDRAGITARWGVYQAVAGTTNPTYMVVVPLRRLADVDTILADEAKFAQTAGPEGLKSLARLTAESTGREEAVILAVDPKLSYPDAEDLAMDPEFWKDWLPKAAPKAKAPKAK